MPGDAAKLYQEVVRHAQRIAVLTAIDATLGWDERTQMPSAGGEYRAEQSTLLAGLMHQQWIDPQFGHNLDALAETIYSGSPPDLALGDGGRDGSRERAASSACGQLVSMDNASVVVRRLKRQYDKRVKLPQSLVEELAGTAILGQQAWQEAREKNDFVSFRPFLEKTIYLKRQQAEALGYPECPYDALLDEYEPEAVTAGVGKVLAELRERLVPLVAEIQHSTRRPNTAVLKRNFPIDVQAAFGREAATAIGFDFARGRLDITAHPFCTTLGPHDCRITTRYDEHFFNSAFFGILHEAGHGIYEQGLPVEHYGLPLGEAVSLGIHESQSRLWENFVGRGRPFWEHFYPLAQRRFPTALADVSRDEFYFAINDVRPSLIRVEADEATYNLHILVRFELERALLQDDLEVADLPGAWNEKYQQYLGLTPPDYRTGVLQDVHWSAGLIGYFPTYALGNLHSAQFFAQATADLSDLDGSLARGEFGPLRDWLREKIHRHGQRWSSAELVERVTNRPLTAQPLIDYLRAKLLPLYAVGVAAPC